MRLDKYVAHNAGLSRKAAQQAIKAGKVQVSNVETGSVEIGDVEVGKHVVAINVATTVSTSQIVTLEGTVLHLPQPIYWMLHKPAGYVCANRDAEHPTVFDLIETQTIHPALRQQLQVVGRLDKDTTGLVLITSDGQWNHRITAPASQCKKRYRVSLAETIAANTEALFKSGLQLKNDAKPCEPAEMVKINNQRCELTISEGKYHQVKRMFAATGNRVTALHRAAIGHLELDEHLEPGKYRALTEQEVMSFEQ